MKITNDFIGNETKALTKTKISAILRWWGFNPDSYSTWGNARSDMNNILSDSSSSTISDRERASSFLSKINYINDTDSVIGDMLFAGVEPGVWFDPSDLSTLFQDAAGTIPVTGVEQPVGRMLDKSGRGNHASQATTTARPILSARYNLLTSTDTLVGGGWVALAPNTVVTPGFSSPLGENTAARVQMPATNGSLLNHPFNAVAGYTYRLRFLARRGGSSTNFSFGFAATANGALTNSIVTDLGDVWREFFVDHTAAASGQLWAGIDNVNNGQAIDVLIAGIDLRLAVDAQSLPSYQRVVSSSEYSTEGFPYYLRFDGVDDHLNIGVLNMSAASTVGYFSAITKLSDAASGRWYTHGLTTTVGSTRLLAPANPGQASVRAGFVSSSGLREVGGAAHAAPITLTVKSEIAPSVGMWITHNNGTWPQTTLDPTVFSADGVACIGAQVFASTRGNFFNGRIYALLVAGRKSSDSEQAVIETFLRNKSRAY